MAVKAHSKLSGFRTFGNLIIRVFKFLRHVRAHFLKSPKGSSTMGIKKYYDAGTSRALDVPSSLRHHLGFRSFSSKKIWGETEAVV